MGWTTELWQGRHLAGCNSNSEGILSFIVIPTKAEGRAEESGREWALREIRGQMSRLRCASLDMTNSARLPPNRGKTQPRRVLNNHFLVVYIPAVPVKNLLGFWTGIG